MNAAAAFSAVFAALFVGHSVGDHWLQTLYQATVKGSRGAAGRLACLRHVITLTLTKMTALILVAGVTGLTIHAAYAAAGLLLDAASHYWADRRTTLAWLAERTGHGEFWRLGQPRPGTDDAPHMGTGSYAMDQSWHHGWLLIAAAIVSAGAA
jgi:hypothetical protein